MGTCTPRSRCMQITEVTTNMDLVSKMLENVITIDPPELDDPQDNTLEPERRGSGSSEHSEPTNIQTVKSPQYSSFWYLDDDPMTAPNQFSEKIMEKLVSLVIRPETDPSPGLDERMEMHKMRPPFSMNLMATNSTQLAQKTSPVFEIFDTMIMVFGWYNPFCTVGALLLVTHAILNPYLVAAFPSFLLLKKFLIPSYLKLYPPDTSLVDGIYFAHNPVPYDGPPLDKFEPPKVCSQYSREFLMNFADLQNFQVGYIRLYDALVAWGLHYFLFEDQELSAVVFLGLLAVAFFNVAVMPYFLPVLLSYMPLKFMSVLLVWCIFGACHPSIKDKILDRIETEDARLTRLDYTSKLENILMRYVTDDDVHDETREVQIFELHKLDRDNIWVPVGFADTFYSLSHHSRVECIQDETPKHKDDEDTTEDETMDEIDQDVHVRRKSSLEDIKPPNNWVFADLKWHIDLDPMAWVTDNCIMDLVNVDDDEKWVYDFVNEGSSPDGNIYRRRRWVRQCKRENLATEKRRDSGWAVSSTQSEWLSKTLNNLSQTVV